MWNGHYSQKNYYTRSSDGAEMSTLGVSLRVTKQAAGQVDTTPKDIVKMWQTVATQRVAPPLVGKHGVPSGNSGDMGDIITTQTIYR
jgi:hypothetical protein